MSKFNDADEVKRQYGTTKNLNSRVLLHELYSTNKLGWGNWVFGNYQLAPDQRILELGCGTAGIWQAYADAVPEGTHLVLSDFSVGMLEAAKANTSALNFVEYMEIDAQSIPYDDNSFDIVIANHMLYHVPDIDKALAEIRRVLKPEGTFYATTLGNNNFKELIGLLRGFDSKIDIGLDAVTNAFGLESGGAKLKKYFGSVEVRRYEDGLHITEAEPLIDYILSMQGIGNVSERIAGGNVARFARYVEEIFAKHSYIDIVKDAGMFVAR